MYHAIAMALVFRHRRPNLTTLRKLTPFLQPPPKLWAPTTGPSSCKRNLMKHVSMHRS